MNTQLVKIVHIMIMLNTVEKSQGRIRKLWPASILRKQIHFTLSIMRIKISDLRGDRAQRRRQQGNKENCSRHQEPYECHRMYPHPAREQEWVQQGGPSFSKGLPLFPFWINISPSYHLCL